MSFSFAVLAYFGRFVNAVLNGTDDVASVVSFLSSVSVFLYHILIIYAVFVFFYHK